MSNETATKVYSVTAFAGGAGALFYVSVPERTMGCVDELAVRPWYEGDQTIVNGHGVPRRFTAAREPVPVLARIAWEYDGVEMLDTYANAWTARLVLVDVSDPRNRINAAWLALADVRRR